MKKIALVIAASGIMASTLTAGTWLTGKAVKMQTWMNDTVFFLKDASDATCTYKFLPQDGTSDEQAKLFKAMYLTALSTGQTVEINVDTVECIPNEGVAPAKANAIKVIAK